MPTSGIIFDLKKYAVHDGPGIRTTVFFKGCPLKCWWCHNPESQQPQPEPRGNFNQKSNLKLLRQHNNRIGKEVSVEEVMTELIKDIIFYQESDGGVTFSGGEPLLQVDFLLALLQACKNNDIHTAVDTCGYASWADFQKINPFVDLYLYDVKLWDDKAHQKLTGVSNQLIHQNLKLISQTGCRIYLRIPLIPGVVDTEANLAQLIRFISSLKNIVQIDLLPYNKIGESKYEKLDRPYLLGKNESQSAEKMEQLTKLFEKTGFPVTKG